MRPTQLLMICLLRRSAALATGAAERGRGRGRGGPRGPRGRASSSSPSASLEAARGGSSGVRDAPAAAAGGGVGDGGGDGGRPPLAGGHIAFRLARRTDVPQIQSCNLATLPENYNANFYANHMRCWPELTLVAEHIPEGYGLATAAAEGGAGGGGKAITPLRDYWARQAALQKGSGAVPRKEIVGYILGKVEERPAEPQRRVFPPSNSRAVPLYNDEDPFSPRRLGVGSDRGGVRFPSRRSRAAPPPPTERVGHVTSLAVRRHARRMGIASSLIGQLHHHLRECHGAKSIGLHVRISNQAAVRLYCDDGYDVADIIPRYYGDGEDAYYMRKDFDKDVAPEAPSQQEQQPTQRQWRRGEREREEWLGRDAARDGSYFDNRKSLRDTLSEEERARAPAATGDGRAPPAATPSMSGQFKRSLRTFFNGGEPSRFRPPPWETGPEGLRLPRYREVTRRAEPASAAAASEAAGLRGLVANLPVVDVENYEGQAEGALSGSV